MRLYLKVHRQHALIDVANAAVLLSLKQLYRLNAVQIKNGDFMAFSLWSNEEMTIEASSPFNLTFNGQGTHEFMLFFGSPDRTEVARAKSGGDIMIMPANQLKHWQPSKYYRDGDIIEPRTANGLMYKCTQAGTSGKDEPNWDTSLLGRENNSGTAKFLNYGNKFIQADVQLALAKQKLDSSVGGAAVSLGEQILGGSPIALYFRVTNRYSRVRSDASDPCIFLATNELTVTKEL